MLIIDSLEKMKPYYNENTKTYVFVDNGKLINVFFTFSIDIKANIIAMDITAENIKAWDITAGDINAIDIKARDIKARDIKAGDIKAGDITAGDINAIDINAGNIFFYAICSAKRTLKCKTIKGIRKNAKYFCLDNEAEFIKANNNSLKELNP